MKTSVDPGPVLVGEWFPDVAFTGNVVRGAAT
jgi:hypothetical protein